jgi:hypothetical protein
VSGVANWRQSPRVHRIERSLPNVVEGAYPRWHHQQSVANDCSWRQSLFFIAVTASSLLSQQQRPASRSVDHLNSLALTTMSHPMSARDILPYHCPARSFHCHPPRHPTARMVRQMLDKTMSASMYQLIHDCIVYAFLVPLV